MEGALLLIQSAELTVTVAAKAGRSRHNLLASGENGLAEEGRQRRKESRNCLKEKPSRRDTSHIGTSARSHWTGKRLNIRVIPFLALARRLFQVATWSWHEVKGRYLAWPVL